jgi:putative restriction endonuclease
VLAEIDGPMLQHGLKDMDGQLIHYPAAMRLRPNKDYLAERFERFRPA